MYRRSFFNYTFSFLFILIGFTLGSCNDPNVVGSGVQPPEDKLNLIYTDSVTVSSQNQKVDSVQSVADASGYAIIGNSKDLTFGDTRTSLYSQFTLNSDSISFYQKYSGVVKKDSFVYRGITVDSVVLNLACNQIVGTISMIQLKVYELKEKIGIRTYFSNDSINAGAEVGGVNKMPEANKVFKIRLPGLESTFDSIKKSDLTESGFADFFKGLYIEAVNDPGGFMKVSLNDTSSKLVVYYTLNSVGTKLKCRFPFTKYYVKHLTNYYEGTSIPTNIASQTISDTLIYLQGAGLKPVFKFPGIKNFSDKGYIINRADLVFSLDESGYNTAPPASLILKAMDGTTIFESSVSSYNSATQKYSFNVSSYIQKVVEHKISDEGLYLLVPNETLSPARVLLTGGKNKKNRIKLLLTYTKI